MKMTITDIARLIDGDVVGDGQVEITGCAGLKEAKEGDLSFLANARYEPLAKESKASVIIVPRQMSLPGKLVIRVEHPSFAFSQVINHLLKDNPPLINPGVHPTAIIAKDAILGKDVAIGPYVVVEPKAVVGDGTKIYAHAYIGHNVKVGINGLIYTHVTLRENVWVGNNVIIHSGTVVGSDGYGYVTVDGKHMKIPQIGTVVIEDDVEIGANVTIDRARFDKTVIGEGTKIDNLVHIAHNVIIGKHCLIVAQVGISGSTLIGNHVILAGQVGIVGHLTIGDGAVVAAQSGVSKSIKAGMQVFGSPAQPLRDAFKNNAHIQRLDHYVAMIQELKKKVEELENRDAKNN
ncbi:MAG: UDP-3-O-(3-hydroxymyristoyl)glucosamine N-acyltransferase [Candidatus Omnitrophica bacterium]|nr:UDP-3-O-(3-hydroxymyristoyl)glucosamine N-acyltransferase [Candidatus Omnitrophota bacterium]